MAHYLVTGAAGFIGSCIAQKLLDYGHSVTTIDNLSTGFKSLLPENCNFIEGNVASIEAIKELKNQQFDAILHLSGQSSGEVSFENPVYDIECNTVSTLRLLDYAVKTGCKRFIYASSMCVYGEQENKEKYHEKDQPSPKSFYAVGKLASEKYLNIYSVQYGLECTSLRYFSVYGENQNFDNLKSGMISIYLKQFIDDNFKQVIVKGSIERFRDLSYVGDIANVTIDAIENHNYFNQIINVGTGYKTSVKSILDQIKQSLNSRKPIVIEEGTPGDQFGIYADVKKLQSIYPIKFIGFESGIKKIISKVIHK